MSESGKAAYITGGASGIGRAIAEMLVGKGAKVVIADRDTKGAQAFADELNKKGDVASAVTVEVLDWEGQVKAFETALAKHKRIDYVYPMAGIAERTWTPHHKGPKDAFVKPDLAVLDVDVTGVLYTVSLALQQFRRQEPDKNGFRGKIGLVASVCGFYCAPTLPIYTAAKHALVGFTRSYGKYLPEEQITMNAVCPNVIRTNISAPTFYDKLDGMNLLTPMKGLIEAFESMLGSNDTSGEIFEVGPNGGYAIKAPPPFLDDESKTVVDMLYHRARPLQRPADEK